MNIQVFRPKQFVDMARDYKLFADDVEVATIKRGVTQTVNIPDSTKNIQAKIDWCSSQTESPRVHRRPVCLSQATLPDSFKLS